MKVVAISDIHGNLKFEIPECDVVCCCGDIVPLNIQNNAIKSTLWLSKDFVKWVDELPCKKFILIGGNHDRLLEHMDNPKELFDGSNKIVYLQDESYEYEGKVFYGSPWCPDLKDWSFYGSHNDLIKHFDKIPMNVDVLLTHCPPRFYQCGVVLEPGWNFGRNFGCQELAEVIQFRDIKWNVFGHVHSGDHNITHLYLHNTTKLVNVSLLDENYKMNYKPFEFEI